MYCRYCLYDLSKTSESRCPECGNAFDPIKRAATTLPTNSRLQWLKYHAKQWLVEGRWWSHRSVAKFCRSCFADLREVDEPRCPVCGERFDPDNAATYCRSDDVLTRLHERFRHICFWRGLVLPVICVTIGVHALVVGRTILPALPRYGWTILEGSEALAMAIAWFGAAIAAGAYFFIGRIESTWRWSGLGIIIGLTMVAGGWGYALLHSFSDVWR